MAGPDGDGAGEKSRTPDLRITNALLYQLSYTGVKLRIIAGLQLYVTQPSSAGSVRCGKVLKLSSEWRLAV
jgi:hypothetical protein